MNQVAGDLVTIPNRSSDLLAAALRASLKNNQEITLTVDG
jgi:hypothetical protein